MDDGALARAGGGPLREPGACGVEAGQAGEIVTRRLVLAVGDRAAQFVHAVAIAAKLLPND